MGLERGRMKQVTVKDIMGSRQRPQKQGEVEGKQPLIKEGRRGSQRARTLVKRSCDLRSGKKEEENDPAGQG